MKYITNFTESDRYRSEIHDLIPGGAHTYSKGDDQFPERSPAAISHGKGAYIWDIDGNKYLDCAMGLSSVSLGHAYEPVLKVVREELEKGVNFQRPAAIERDMAKAFLSLIPCHQMIKFAKNGSITTTAAVKLARAATGRKYVVFPKDYPFFSYDDWFISQKDCNRGIPNETTSLSLTYYSKDLNTLEELFKKYPGQIAAVISEPEKYNQPQEYLRDLIQLTHKYGALFIQDEIVTGFKVDFPGAISKYNVEPDLATWGKGIANGFSFAALTGKKEIMELGGIKKEGAEKVFLISTTNGGETHSIAAALATLEIFKEQKVLKHNHEIGRYFIDKIQKLINHKDLNECVSLSNQVWMPGFGFMDKNRSFCPGFASLIEQEMFKRGIFFHGSFVLCYSHTKADVDLFAAAFDEALDVYKQALTAGYEKYLIGKPFKSVFRKII